MNHLDQFPLFEKLDGNLRPEDVFLCLADQPHVVFFDSASRESDLGRFSFLAADPFEWITQTADSGDALKKLAAALQQHPALPHADLPPFQGGAAGLLGYDLARNFETLPRAAIDDFPMPALAVGLYDVVVAFDHETAESWIISQGFPEVEFEARRERAEFRLRQMKHWLARGPQVPSSVVSQSISESQLAPQFSVEANGITSNFSADAYRQMIRRAVDYIHAGDVFQVNLSQRLLCVARSGSVELYLRLREKNPAPYAGYFDLGDWQVCSSSPECFLTLRNSEVETRPIKGTRGHGSPILQIQRHAGASFPTLRRQPGRFRYRRWSRCGGP